MHGLVNKSIESFVTDTYGPDLWRQVCDDLGTPGLSFEPLLHYDDTQTHDLIASVAASLGKPHQEVLEDVGTYLVSHQNTQAIRRLLRFCGATFYDFVLSLDTLRDRARLAVDDLDLPRLDGASMNEGTIILKVQPIWSGFSDVLVGLIRAMADDYGALVFIQRDFVPQGWDRIEVILIQHDFGSGNSFDLSVSATS